MGFTNVSGFHASHKRKRPCESLIHIFHLHCAMRSIDTMLECGGWGGRAGVFYARLFDGSTER